MPGSAFDASGPPDGDYARYLERLSAGSATPSSDPTRQEPGRQSVETAARASAAESRPDSHARSAATRAAQDAHADPLAEHRWGHAAADDGNEDLATGLDACPGPAPGFGLDQAGTPASGARGRSSRSGRAGHNASPAGAASRPPRRVLGVLALLLILAGIAAIALAALPPEPWFSTPLPGFVLLVAGLHLRSRARRHRRSRHSRHSRHSQSIRT